MEFEEEKEDEEERKQEAAERKATRTVSQGMQGRGLSQEKDDEGDLSDESSVKRRSSMSAATTTAETQTLCLSKFGNLSVGGGGAETDMGAETGNGPGEGDDVFQSMSAECIVCIQERKVRQ